MGTDLPERWRWTRIGEHFQQVRRKNAAGVTRVLTASGNHGLVSQEEFFNRRVAASEIGHYYLLSRGEFAYNRSAMNGYPFGAIKRLVDYDEGALSTLYICFGMRSEAQVDPDFAVYLFDSDQLNGELGTICAVGARAHGLLNVTPSDFFQVSFQLPPLSEQRKIAAILSSVDDAVAATRKVIEQAKRVKQGLLQTLMTRGIGHTRFKSVPEDWVTGRLPGLEEIPDEWEVTRLTDVARLESGHTPARGRDDYWGGDVPWVSLHDTDRLAQRVIRDTAMTVTETGLANSSARLLPEGTVVFSRTATVGRCSILGRPMATSQDFANYVCGPRVHNRFLCHLFRSMGAVWKSLCAGSTHQTVYMPDFKKLRIALPPVAEQVEIAARVDAVDDMLETWPPYLHSLNHLKRGLMQDLLTGRVRVRLD